MAAEKSKPVPFTFTTPVRAPYLSVIEARAFKGSKEEPKFDATFVADPDHVDVVALKAKFAEVARARWPGRDFAQLKFPITTGAKMIANSLKMAEKKSTAPKAYPFFEGNVLVFKARSKFRPVLGRIVNGKVIDLTEADMKSGKYFYGGGYVVPEFGINTYIAEKADDKDGLNLFLNSLLWVKDGEKVGGGQASAAEKFSAFAGTVTDVSPGTDDEIPF